MLTVWGDGGGRRLPTYFSRGTASPHLFVDKWVDGVRRPPASFGASPNFCWGNGGGGTASSHIFVLCVCRGQRKKFDLHPPHPPTVESRAAAVPPLLFLHFQSTACTCINLRCSYAATELCNEA